MSGVTRDENWYVETKKKIREAFQLFDKDRKGCVIQEEVRTSRTAAGNEEEATR